MVDGRRAMACLGGPGRTIKQTVNDDRFEANEIRFFERLSARNERMLFVEKGENNSTNS
jgi:hypothetical protein